MSETGVKFPQVKVKLVGEDGNAFAIMGRVCKEMRRKGVGERDVMAFLEEAKRGNYDHLLATVMKTVEVE